MAPTRHSMTEMHRATNDATGANIAAGQVPIADGAGNVAWAAGSGGASVMWFNVLDYGGVADSATDNRAAIVAADAAAAAVGGIVYFPASDDTYYVLWDSVRDGIKPSAGVTWLGDGMFSSVIEMDPGSTIATSSAGQPFIEIGSATAGANNITLRDLGIIVHQSTLGNDTDKFLNGIVAQQDTTGTAHSDHITIERVRVYDSNAGIVCTKGSLAPAATNRHDSWSVRDCVVELTENKAIEFDQAQDSAMTGNVVIDAQDGLQFLNYTARSIMSGNRVEYKDAGINLSEGISDCDIGDNVCRAIAGGGIGFNGGLVIRRESYTSTGPTSSRVVIHDNVFDDSLSDASAHKIGIQFATYTGNTGVATFEDYEIVNNLFYADINYLHDAWFPAKSQAVRLRIFDNYFSDEVITHVDWVSDRTRVERNHVTAAFTAATDDWDYRGNVFEAGAPTVSGTGITFADLVIEDEGTPLTNAPTSIDFVGAGVTVTESGYAATVTIPGGSGSVVKVGTPIIRTAGSLTVNGTTWVELAAQTGGPGTGGFDFDFTGCVAGDVAEFTMNVGWGSEAVVGELTVATIVSAAVVNYFMGAPTSSSGDGIVGLYGPASVFVGQGATASYVLVSGDLSAGALKLRPMVRTATAGNKTLYATTGDSLMLMAKVYRP